MGRLTWHSGRGGGGWFVGSYFIRMWCGRAKGARVRVGVLTWSWMGWVGILRLGGHGGGSGCGIGVSADVAAVIFSGWYALGAAAIEFLTLTHGRTA